ncbi:hypothetical protein [Streptomyces sp. URMC 123]|uniref:hypothetical protein n=1 Tax=Streptomyces sp. URMC 123 TaxID=3423403 RepID=UPI003F193CC8
MHTLDWIPRGAGVNIARAGRCHGWDAVRMPRLWALRVLAHLGDRSGAVVAEEAGASPRYSWLVAAGSADRWAWPEAYEIQVLGEGCRLTVPGLARDRLVRWAVPPGPDRLLTDAARLRAAVAAALVARVTPGAPRA